MNGLPHNISDQLDKFEDRVKLIQEAKLQDNKLVRGLLALSCSRLTGVARHAGQALDERLLRPVVLQRLLAANYVPPMDFDPSTAVMLGLHHELKVPILIPRKRLTENLLVIGAVGSGKTNYLFYLMEQLVQQGVHITFYDFKGEAPRLLNAYA